ncbi:hypothetical protein GE061_002431 [Apolygus lucorum]|uniref:Uncharacterized protein n=1 Tax=Apolygus lucorum TaxID=248454 RepID=A0A8S9X6Y9_APOLU|nr:hypothetical protein GE061_002431 [Apolygus lucorum]
MNEATENAKTSEMDSKGQSREVVRISSGKSSGDVPKNLEIKKSSSQKLKPKSAKEPFANTMRKMKSFRRGMKKLWDVWSGFKKSTPALPKKRSRPTLGVPGFEEIACIDVDVPDIMITDKDRIRTSCKQCLKNPPKFPTKEQVKSKLIAADKYYGVNKFAQNRENALERSDSLEHDADYFDDEGKVIRPSWRFILERPLVEQYVLMTNYIRKVSILSELEGTLNNEAIEEDESGSDTEYEKFTQKHKIETQNFLASMRAPRMKETAVQTSTKSLEGLVEPVSEISLYPDSGSSNESSPSKRELSAITVIDSHDLSSPLQSDVDNIHAVNGSSVKSAVRWWESKEPPHTSESFPTSCDSAKDVSIGTPTIHHQPDRDWSGSSSDGTFIPIHNATGKISLKLDGRGRNQEGKTQDQPHPHYMIPPTTAEKGTTTKKVTFSPVVKYFNAPEKNNPVFSLPKQFEEDAESVKQMDAKLRSLNEGRITHSLDQKHIILQLGSTPKDGHQGFSVINNLGDTSDVASTYLQPQATHRSAVNDRLPRENKIPERRNLAERPGGSSTDYRSSSPETATVLSSSEHHSFPQRTTEQISNKQEKQSEESKESSSNSSERIALKPSPAMFFKPGATCTITQLATDKFYPEVPDIDEDKEERANRTRIFQEERRDVRSLPGSPARFRTVDGRLNNFAANPGFAQFVIVRGTTPQTEHGANQIHWSNQQRKNLDSLDVRGRNEQRRMVRSPERLYDNYSAFVDHRQVHQDGSALNCAAMEIRETSPYRTLLEDLHSINPLNTDYTYPQGKHPNQQFTIHPKIPEQQRGREGRVSVDHQQKTLNLEVPSQLPRGTNFLEVQEQRTGPAERIIEEEQRALKRETTQVHLEEPGVDCLLDRNIKITENDFKGPPRAGVVTSSLASNRILPKISEELNYLSTDRLDPLNPSLRTQNLESYEDVKNMASYEDFSKFDVLKTSQIYSSSSSFITPSEERMAFELQLEGKLFQPMVVEDIAPEVTLMPSQNERSVSFDRTASFKVSSLDKDEPEVNKCPPQEQNIKTIEINYRPATEMRYPKQFETIVPSYTLIGCVQYAVEDKVEIITDKITYKETKNEGCVSNNEVIESNIEYVLQKVHETINIRTNRSEVEVHTDTAKSQVSAPKQWLMDVIPTVVKTSTKTPARQLSVTTKVHLGRRSNEPLNPEDVKPDTERWQKRSSESDPLGLQTGLTGGDRAQHGEQADLEESVEADD